MEGAATRQDAESHPQKRLGRHFFRGLVLQIPDAIPMSERLEVHAAFRLDADLEPAGHACARAARGRSRGRSDSVTVRMRRADAIDAT